MVEVHGARDEGAWWRCMGHGTRVHGGVCIACGAEVHGAYSLLPITEKLTSSFIPYPPTWHRRVLWDRYSLSWRPSLRPFVSPTGLGIGPVPSTSSSWRQGQHLPGGQQQQQRQHLPGKQQQQPLAVNPVDCRTRLVPKMMGAQHPPGATGPISL